METVRNKTKTVLSVFAMILALMFAVTSGGWLDLGAWFVPIIGIMLGMVIIVEAGISQYFNKSGYKSLNVRDFLNMVSGVFGAAAIIQGLLLVPILRENVPMAVIDWFGTIGAIVGVGAALFALLHLLMKD